MCRGWLYCSILLSFACVVAQQSRDGYRPHLAFIAMLEEFDRDTNPGKSILRHVRFHRPREIRADGTLADAVPESSTPRMRGSSDQKVHDNTQ